MLLLSGFPCGKGEELDVNKAGVAAAGELTDAAAVCEAVAEGVEAARV